MMSIYKSIESEKMILDLYDSQVRGLRIDYEELYVNTRYGETHVLKIGNPDAKPVIFFHGGNSTSAFSLSKNLHLFKDYLVHAPSTIGHPGKSVQKVLSSSTLEYGEWASDVIESLGYKEMICIGESFGGGILTKLMCTSPDRISKSILLVPAGISNASKYKLMLSMGIPMLLYLITKKEEWFKRAFLPMATLNESIDHETLQMIRTTFHHVKVNPNMPTNVKANEIRNYTSPTLLFAGENDVLFPGEKVIKRAKDIIPNVEAHLLRKCGHLYFSSEERMKYIKQIVNDFLSK
ncbi:alpha/beta fold hydrolase [Halalkalibacterium halodurans]|uniref:alpha/beta fold hydrolase n=1 Tax=Halalkalibacterium halodurans TaxID=86665 RepID=UPI002AA9CDB0|nr:alpha/beta hydrolase [Halalkalibacterium halodurans]MDY7221182.1 alpha/beta hydrolase [Halalkalibacterium halodurans]MDY7240421.1 alpha/beta hydrolase [Halalkalibacterium halodurans]